MTIALQDTAIVALILAAGHSRRFGTDKRRARLADGRPLLHATLDLAAHCFAETWIVLRQGEPPDELGLPASARVIHAPEEAVGLGTSLAAGFSTLLAEETNAEAAAVMLGDMPWIQPATCRALSAHASPAHIVRPRHAGRTGHPVLFGRDFWPMLAQLRGDRGASDVVRDNASACRVIEVGDGGILSDVDTPDDLLR